MKSVNQFTQKQATVLSAFLEAPIRPPHTMTYWETVGFLFVVACSPEMIKPSEWLPLVYSSAGNDDNSVEATEEMLDALMGLYNELNRQVQASDVNLLPGCEFHDDPMENMKKDAPISQWAQGFVRGYNWLEAVWSEYVPEELDEEAGSHMLVLSFFCDATIAESFMEVGVKKDVTLEVMAANIQAIFIDAMRDFALLGWSIQQASLEYDTQPNQSAQNAKIGRNDPCPCGSDKKYKKCCGLAPN